MSGAAPWAAARRRARYGSSAAPASDDGHFPPAARLHTRRDFGRLFHRQQKAASRDLVLLLAPRRALRDGNPARARLGIQVSVKVAKRAVRRHQLKRWLREWFRCEGQHALVGFDCAVLVRQDPRDHAAVLKQITGLVPRALQATPAPRSGNRRRRK